ncbi:TonB-dependent receptor [Glaciecola siphonariae]|uniref:TonB-dependent receptor n=1 Tax=Glaciecola siphonariae TaxID=521012 RepID=A0ABV9LV22_9ALTE
MKHNKFFRTRISAAVSLVLGSAMMGSAMMVPVHAQENETNNLDEETTVEIIEISGIRGSLARSQDIKRSSSGIVDAISAEEMGKFPDTNLAESLQRITGITISRNNNEGSQITARGFGPDFNLLLLNGRQMPGTGNSRSFNLENLSSEGVSELLVYKSGRPDVPSGGLGVTVDILTAKPLSSPGLKYSVSAKGLYDESNVEGDDVTPEIAALYSQTFADDTIGVSLSASYQERSFQQQSANIPGWLANTGAFSSASSFVDLRPDAMSEEEDIAVNGNPALAGALDGKAGPTFMPRQISYDLRDIQRERTNAHLTLQWAPTDNMTLSADYMMAESQTANEGYGFGIWFNFGGNVDSYELDENGTAVRFTEVDNDFAHSRTSDTLLVEQKSIGFNFEWFINDDFAVELDYHDSSVETDNGLDSGTNASSLLIIAPNNIVNKTYDFTSGQIPNFEMTWPNGAAEASASDIDPLFAQFSRGIGESGVKQFQFNSQWTNPNDSFLTNVKFGLAHTEQTFGGRSGFSGNQGPNGYNGNQAIFPDSMFTRVATDDLLDDFDGGGANLSTNYYFDWDLGEALSRMATFFPGFTSDPFNENGQISENDLTETTQSAYLNASMYFEIADMPLDVNVGLRYEETEVDSNNLQRAEDFVVWSNPTEWQLRFQSGGDTFVNGTGEHDVLLPAIDFKLEIQEDLFARMSFGKTISRAPLGNLNVGRSLSANPKPDSRIGSAGNPSLDPFESVNFDVAAEWYYEESSYVSLTYFRKDVKNFISDGLNIITVDNLRDPLIGPRANAARAALEAEGLPLTVTNVWERIIADGGGVDDACCQTQIVRQNADDPLIEWQVSQPVNDPDSKTVDGIEFAIQHMFWDTGFGASFNTTIVNSDTEYDVSLLAVQSPLIGVSDSANIQLFYEDDSWSVKLTHAWRDSYLAGVGQTQGSADAPPQFIEETNITDFSVNYSYDENLTFFLEGYNITNEVEEGYGRYRNQFLFGRQYGARYGFGARYSF